MSKTVSLCPECLSRIDAEVYEENGKVMMRKICPEHGEFEDVYWSDSKLLKRFMKYDHYIFPLKNPLTKTEEGCPYDCGICPEHKSSTILCNIDITNRCNQRCPICFANAAVQGYVFEPSKEQIKKMFEVLRNQKPVPCSVIQFSGGEPTVREDLPDLIRMAKEMGFSQIQVATNGVRIAEDIEYLKKLKDAGLNTIYLQFDGITEAPYIEARGYNALPKKLKVIENCRKIGFDSITLVPTLVRGVNDHQIGDMIRFVVENRDVVRSLNVQPVSFTGRISKRELKEKRITIPDFLQLVEEQTDGQIRKEDFYPVPCVGSIANFIEAWKNEPVGFPTCHPACGAATFVFVEDGKLIPITRFIDVEGLFELLDELTGEIKNKGKIGKITSLAKLSKEILKLVDLKQMPKSSNIPHLVTNLLKEGKREALAELFKNSIFIGCMHFMDPYNLDRERIQRCVIHYAVPDGRVIPFCTYNTIHRQSVERKFAKLLTKVPGDGIKNR